MAIISGNVSNLYDARIGKAYYLYLNMFPPEYTSWCDVRSSKQQYEKESLYGELPMPDEVGEYENFPETSLSEGPVRTWTHKKFGYKLIASRESFEDERFPVIVRTAEAMGEAMRHRIETEGAYDLINSFTASTVGKSDTADETLCATSHATFAGAGGAAQANAPAVDVTLGTDSLWAAIDNFAGLDDHEGNPIMQVPRKLIIPPQYKRKAKEILNSEGMPYKSTNEDNALYSEGLQYVIGHYLNTSSTYWWVITDKKPIIFFMRRPPEIKMEDTITNDSKTWVISTRLSHAPLDWYPIYGTDGAA